MFTNIESVTLELSTRDNNTGMNMEYIFIYPGSIDTSLTAGSKCLLDFTTSNKIRCDGIKSLDLTKTIWFSCMFYILPNNLALSQVYFEDKVVATISVNVKDYQQGSASETISTVLSIPTKYKIIYEAGNVFDLTTLKTKGQL